MNRMTRGEPCPSRNLPAFFCSNPAGYGFGGLPPGSPRGWGFFVFLHPRVSFPPGRGLTGRAEMLAARAWRGRVGVV